MAFAALWITRMNFNRLTEGTLTGTGLYWLPPPQAVSQLSQNLVLEFIFQNTGEVISLKFPGRCVFSDLARV
jgi:hypothetical protein